MTTPDSTAATLPTLLILDDVKGVYVDALVQHKDTGALLFGSFWGRDTAIQELLARLSLGLTEGGLAALRMTGFNRADQTYRVLIESPEQLAKLTGRMPAASLFGEVAHVWLYVPLVVQPDYAGRRALRVLRTDADLDLRQARESAVQSDTIWALFKEVSHLPLLDDWREPVLGGAFEQGWLIFHAGHGVHALEINLGTDDCYELAISELIVAGQLRLPEDYEVVAPATPLAPGFGAHGGAEPPSGGDGDPKPAAATERERRLTSDELESRLAWFTGTAQWFQHPLVRSMTYTEGVRFFAREGGEQGAYWFLDIVATEFFPLLKKQPFLHIRLLVARPSETERSAVIEVDDGNGKILKRREIPYTDMQAGEWTFYLTDNVLLLPSEY
jgi:hypothetical protein